MVDVTFDGFDSFYIRAVSSSGQCNLCLAWNFLWLSQHKSEGIGLGGTFGYYSRRIDIGLTDHKLGDWIQHITKRARASELVSQS